MTFRADRAAHQPIARRLRRARLEPGVRDEAAGV